MTAIPQSPGWQALVDHHYNIAPVDLRALFTADARRGAT